MFALNFIKNILCYNTNINPRMIEDMDLCIGNTLLNKVLNMQKKALILDSIYDKNVECCICYDVNIDKAYIKCQHPLCIKCYHQLMKRNYVKCPVCQQNMEMIYHYKFFCIMKFVNENTIAVFYFPPIYDSAIGQCKDDDFFYNININKTNFIKCCNNIKRYGYATVINKPITKQQLEFLKQYIAILIDI